jgi:hypothetical protein
MVDSNFTRGKETEMTGSSCLYNGCTEGASIFVYSCPGGKPFIPSINSHLGRGRVGLLPPYSVPPHPVPGLGDMRRQESPLHNPLGVHE